MATDKDKSPSVRFPLIVRDGGPEFTVHFNTADERKKAVTNLLKRSRSGLEPIETADRGLWWPLGEVMSLFVPPA